jgi:ubiquinol-cytochrome c reductase cytochrome b subunit
VPGLIFGALFVVPWIERRLTGDTAEHHLLDRPRDAPVRTAFGAAGITFVAVLFLGGSQDVIAGTFGMSIETVTLILQVAAVVGPPIAWYVTWQLCRNLAARPGPERTERAGAVARDPTGGYHGVAAPTELIGAEDVVEAEATMGSGE